MVVMRNSIKNGLRKINIVRMDVSISVFPIIINRDHYSDYEEVNINYLLLCFNSFIYTFIYSYLLYNMFIYNN